MLALNLDVPLSIAEVDAPRQSQIPADVQVRPIRLTFSHTPPVMNERDLRQTRG